MAGVKVLGVGGVLRSIDKLGKADVRKATRQAARQAAKPVLASAKADAPVETGALRSSLRAKTYFAPSSGTFHGMVYVGRNKRKGKKVAGKSTTRYAPAAQRRHGFMDGPRRQAPGEMRKALESAIGQVVSSRGGRI